MLILTIKTDQPQAELSLYDDSELVERYEWLAHRQLAETLHLEIDKLLSRHDYQLADVTGLVAYKGPGSFTGLRIGLAVANALAYSLKLPIVGVEGADGTDTAWQLPGIEQLTSGSTEQIVLPEYGADPHITPQKK